MEISLAHQFTVALLSVILGLLLGLLYDCVRITRCLFGIEYKGIIFKRLQPQHSIKSIGKVYESLLMGITDLIYFALCGIIMSIFVYFVNSGNVRWYIFLGAGVGFFLYYVTVGRMVISLSSVIALGIRKAFFIILSCLYEPVRPIALFIKNALIKVVKALFVNRKSATSKKQPIARNVLINYGRKN